MGRHYYYGSRSWNNWTADGKARFFKRGILPCVVILGLSALVFRSDDPRLLIMLVPCLFFLVGSWLTAERITYYYDDHYCADCGQYLGRSPATCSRCGCNRYTTEDSGVGQTIRHR